MAPSFYVHHCTSQPFHFFGRDAELALLDRALNDPTVSLVAFLGPGGQGKTAILQKWLGQLTQRGDLAGVFFWSFYRGKDVDLFLRELYATVANLAQVPDVAASYCVDHLLPRLRSQRWVVLLDGTEVVQHEGGPWAGRFLHPDLGRLLEELASAPQPGVTVLTTRFTLPELERRPHARLIALTSLDPTSARELLTSLGVRGSAADLDEAARAVGLHAKAVELLGTYLVRFHGGEAGRFRTLPETPAQPDMSEEEHKVLRVLTAYQAALGREAQDVLALATAFRDPPTEPRLLEYLASEPARALLHETWKRTYPPFAERGPKWLEDQVDELVQLRLLERVGRGPAGSAAALVLDAHPLVRRAFESALGGAGRRQSAGARAGFLRGRPDRRRAATLEEAREDVELFHAYCDAGLWEEADGVLRALDRPRYRFLAPAFERDLLLRFYPHGDWHRPPLWPRFAHRRALAICFELLGRYTDALDAYPPEDAPLRGDSLLAVGQFAPLLREDRPPPRWELLWQAYRAHALCLAGHVTEALELTRRLVPRDVYEWTHLFECLLRAGQLTVLDMNSFLYRPPNATEGRWSELGRQRLRADYLRAAGNDRSPELVALYESLLEGYDQGGLPYERVLTRLGLARLLLAREEADKAAAVNAVALDVARRHALRILEVDALEIETALGRVGAQEEAARRRNELHYHGPERP